MSDSPYQQIETRAQFQDYIAMVERMTNVKNLVLRRDCCNKFGHSDPHKFDFGLQHCKFCFMPLKYSP